MRNSHQKDQLTAKKKSLSIHIDTPLIGPHGMPLIYGSTPNRIGFIRGTVRFSSNYDCKGRDIQIIYEAWSESRWTVMENKKMVQHHAKKVLGYQTWSFPLVHTKSHGSTVVKGNYEQDFEALFIKPSSSSSAQPFTSTHTSCESTPSSSPTSSSISTHSHSHSLNHLRTPPLSSSSSASSIHSTISTSSISSRTQTILPSSSTNPNCTVKYTIRAVLTRPFPSLSNVEASQEVWVVHSSGNTTPSNKCSATSLPHMESSPIEQQSTSALDGETTTSTTSPFMSTPASKIASDWSASSSLTSRKVTPMPSTPYGRNQLVVFIYYFCTIVLGLGFCQRYSGVVAPSTASLTSTGSSSL